MCTNQQTHLASVSDDELLQRYASENRKRTSSLIFGVGLDAGFFSELNNMIFAMLFCSVNNIRFRLHSSSANFLTTNGWQDYFLPFCAETNSSLLDLVDYRYPESRMSRKRRLLRGIAYAIHSTDFLTSDLFHRIRIFAKQNAQRLHYNSPDRQPFSLDLHTLAKIVWRFNDETADQMEKQIAELALPESYIGLHIRRGDKISEAPLESVESYMNLVVNQTTSKNAFVLTDDFRVINELRITYPDWSFFTFAQTGECGYDHKEHLRQSKEARRIAMIKLLASVETLRRSDFFVGTYHSNPGKFLGMLRPEGTHSGVDNSIWFA